MQKLLQALYREFILQDEVRSQFRNEFLTVPNAVTGFGLVCCVLYVLQYTIGYAESLIPITVVLIAVSDLFDGLIARHCGQHSWFGKVFDPFRDKCARLAVMGNLVAIVGAPVILPFCLLVVAEGITTRWEWHHYQTRTVVHGHPLVRFCQPFALLLIFMITIDLYWISVGLPLVILAWFFALARFAAIPFSMRTAKEAR